MQDLLGNNEVIHSDEVFYISYLQERSGVVKALDTFASSLTGKFHKDLPETALCVRTGLPGLKSVRCYILYNDHREAYRKLAPQGLSACLDYFKANIDQMAPTSASLPETH